MKKESEKIDAYIKEALTKEQDEFYEQLEEQSIIEMVAGLYQGKMKWLNLGSIVVTLVFTGLAIYCLINFLEVESTNDLIRWGLWFILCAMTTSMLKIWGWQQMNANAMLREIKRLELTIANMAAKQGK